MPIAFGPIDHLTRGWAVFPFVGKCAHYWIEDTETMMPQIRDGDRVRYYRASCGALGVTSHKVPALDAGDYPMCKNCQKRLKGK